MWESLHTVRKYLWRYRRGMAAGGLCLVMKDLAQALQPLMIRGAVDSFRNGAVFVRFAGYLVGLALLKGIFQYWMRVILIGISRDIEFDLRNDLFAHLIRLSPEYYARTRTGDIMARATNDLNAVRMMLGPGVMYWFETSLTFILAIAIMTRVDWRLALFAVMPAPGGQPGRQPVRPCDPRPVRADTGDVQRHFEPRAGEPRRRAHDPRLRAGEGRDAPLRDLEPATTSRRISGWSACRDVFQPLLESLIGVTFLVVLWVGGKQVLAGRISVGSFVMFNTYMGMLVWPMIALGWVVNLMQRGSASLQRINDILREQPSIAAPPDPVGLGAVRGEIEFRQATVDYGSGPALDGIDLRIPAGTTLAVVGHTGSGKSTLVNLLPRLFDPTGGAVLLDGIDLRRADPAELRRHIGFVPQETFLFSATIAGNIAFGVEDATAEQIRRAAEMAGLAGDIEGFPLGYDTLVGERGITLSGGQKQRTAIARALLREPRILILDDALSAVDTLTEERILTHLAGVMRGRTVILISHRVSTVRQADSIVVLEHGKIVERGTHEELVEAGGYYAALSQKQMLEEELEAI